MAAGKYLLHTEKRHANRLPPHGRFWKFWAVVLLRVGSSLKAGDINALPDSTVASIHLRVSLFVIDLTVKQCVRFFLCRILVFNALTFNTVARANF